MSKRLLLTLLLLLPVAAGIWHFLPDSRLLPEDLPLTFTDGTHTTFGELRGKPLMLAFWSVNCPACLNDMPKLTQLRRQLGPQGIHVIAVSIPQDPPPAIMATVRKFQPGYPTALDVQGEIARSVGGVDATPMTLFIDRQGRIVRRIYGKLDLTSVRATLKTL